MGTGPDVFLVPKPGKRDYAEKLWEKRSNLLLVNPHAVESNANSGSILLRTPILGSAFVPVTPNGGNHEALCKAWCVWFNSTPGIIAFLNIRQKNSCRIQIFPLMAYARFLSPTRDECDIDRLVAAYNNFANEISSGISPNERRSRPQCP